MSPVKIYFALGLAMFLIVLWDYKKLETTARRLARSDENAKGFARIALEIRNLAVMSLFSFFLWPVVLFWEMTGGKWK